LLGLQWFILICRLQV